MTIAAQASRPAELTGTMIGSDYQWRQGPAELTIERESDTHGLITVRWHDGPPGAPLVFATYGMLGAQTVGGLTKACSAAVPRFDWGSFFRSALYQTNRHWRDGDDPDDITTIHGATPSFLINPLLLAARATSLIAPGGSSKSYLAMAMSLAVATGSSAVFAGYAPQQTGPVLYLDWEEENPTHRYRLDRLCRGADISLLEKTYYHYHPRSRLADMARAMERRVATLGIRLVVIDSVMLARGFRNTALGGAPDTGEFYEALNRIGVPALLVDHTAGDDKSGKRGAFGSVVNENTARLQWVLHPQWEGDNLYATLTVHKTNNTSRNLPAIGLRVEHDNEKDLVRVVRDTRRLASITADTAKDQVKEFLQGGGEGTPTEIADALGLAMKTVSGRLSELAKQGVAGSWKGRWHSLAQGTENLI